MAPRLVQRPTIPRGLQTELLGDGPTQNTNSLLSLVSLLEYGLDGPLACFTLLI